MDHFTQKVSTTREHLGLTQEQLGKAMGYSRNYISMIEGGREPGKTFLRAWAEFEAEHGLSGEQPDAGEGSSVVREEPLANGARHQLKIARMAAGLSISQLARQTGYAAGVLEAVENGSARASEKMIEAMCRALPGLDKELLMQGSDAPRIMHRSGIEGTYGAKPDLIVPRGSTARYVPLLSWAQAGALDAGHSDDGYDFTGVISIDIKDPRAFAVEIRGKSMEPRISEGDRAIVCPGAQPRPGDTVIARTLNGDVMCKLYQAKEGGELVILSSWNPAFPPVEIRREEIAWIYPVRQVVQDYGRD
jgi:phage repressor protein C with HTH and peptisase S24 domain